LSDIASRETSQGVDLETKLRRAASEAFQRHGAGAVDNEMLEAVACQACEVLEAHEGTDNDTQSTTEALVQALTPLLEEVECDVLDIVSSLMCAAELADAVKELPTQLSLPSLRGARPNVAPKEYRKRGDVERDRATEYLREQAVEVSRQKEVDAARTREAVDFRRWPQGLPKEDVGPAPGLVPAGEAAKSDSDDEEDEITRKDREMTKRRLRELGQPATFFAETDAQRYRRLQSCELSRDQDVLADGSTNVMQILDRRQQREREAAGGIRQGVDIVDAEDAEFATLEGTVTRHEPNDDSDSEDDGPKLAVVLGSEPDERDKEQEEAQPKLDAASHAVMTWIRSMLRAWEAQLT